MSCRGPSAAPAMVMPQPRGDARIFSPEQMAGSELRSKAPRTPLSDTSGTLKRVMIYRWKFDYRKTAEEIAQYGRDGCSRWYPGRGFVRRWDSRYESDPGMYGFLEHQRATLVDDPEAKYK
eukprot:16164317-Heterocapsa_arctica.AAC.1